MTLKKFINRLFSKGKVGPSEEKSGEDDWNEKRRSNRVDLQIGDEVLIKLHPEGKEKDPPMVASVKNVSLRGCRLVFTNKSDREQIQLGQHYVATLASSEFSVPLQVEVARFVGDVEVGIRFKPPFPKELERLERYLEPRCLGVSMREISQSSLKEGDQGKFSWFHGINDTSLFSWIDSGTKEIYQQQLVFLQFVVEWQKDQSLRTGRIKEDPSSFSSHYGWVRSELMTFDEKPDQTILDQGKALLEAMRLEAEEKDLFLKKLK